MKFFKFLSLFVLFSTGHAIEFNPWFSPPFEFYGRVGYFCEKVHTVTTPSGNFSEEITNSTLLTSLDFTPWPYWNVEAEVLWTHTKNVSFSFEAANLAIRYAWLDDLNQDPFTLVTGCVFAFPSSRFLKNFSFDYHGRINAELYTVIGKEFSRKNDWLFRIWGLGGYGIANRGSPWLHGLFVLEFRPFLCLEAGLFTESVYAFGDKNIIPNVPFNGYASIAHRSVDVGGFINYPLGYLGTLSLMGWYNLYAHNYISHFWGGGLSLSIPFSLFDVPLCL